MDNIVEYVKEKWTQLTAFSSKESVKQQLWNDIVYRYAEPHRHYHNLTHIAYLFSWCDKYLSSIKQPAVVGFAIIYHDIVFDTFRNDNEEQSAAVAEAHLSQLNINKNLLKQIKHFIVASKEHQLTDDETANNDLALFLDFDIAILSADENLYKLYSQKIRKEFSKYNDETYKAGRKAALMKLLEQPHIYQSTVFREEAEVAARENINSEINLL